jgi:25S rRNA (uracil2634-N3)-methyltransferase
MFMNKLELLVSFFKNSLQSLSPKPGSSIIVTLFEGEPYTLWNIRDLGRHSGLEVKRSWRFQASAYPGYRHARTLGVVKGKNGEVGGGWKGEERAARSYEFVRKGEGVVMGIGKKRKESNDDEDEDEDMEEDESLQGEENEDQWEGLDDEDIHEEGSGTENDDKDEDGD